MPTRTLVLCSLLVLTSLASRADDREDLAFFEKRIRPILVEHCYKCHSEAEEKRRGGLLLDRPEGWLEGGDTGKAVLPRRPDESLLIQAVRYTEDDLRMPPRYRLKPEDVRLLETWVSRGAPAPKMRANDTEFSRLGDQDYLFGKAKDHWAFQPVDRVEPPVSPNAEWNRHAIDRFVFAKMAKHNLTPSARADARTLIRRLTYDLTGLPPTSADVNKFILAYQKNPTETVANAVDELLATSAFGEHFARMWLDVARYADTDSFYRPDTKTPHYFPFAFTYRDYVVDSFNKDRPYNEFVRQQFAADLLGYTDDAPELAALGFLTVGPHANRNPTEAIDDWIDVTTRGLLGLTVACARCHDHKFEPIPTADYYSLTGVFFSIERPSPLDETSQPTIAGYSVSEADRADYEKKRAAIDAKIKAAEGKVAKGNNRSIAERIRETELAKLLLFHPGAPTHTMIVKEGPRPVTPFIFLRGDRTSRGDRVPRRFLKILDAEQQPFSAKDSGRRDLAEKIVAPDNPLTARVFVNRVWGTLIGSHLVATPSNFGLGGESPTHPELLDWLADEFRTNGWSLKHLVRTIVLSQTYQQSSVSREEMASNDPANQYLWRANRKHLSIEELRDSLLAVSGQLDRTQRGRPARLWGEEYTHRRSLYGYVNRFNLDPTLRTFDFPTPMQSQPKRDESIVPAQALFSLNAPFVIDQAKALTELERFTQSNTDEERIDTLYDAIFQREPSGKESRRIVAFVKTQKTPWPLVAQALLMSNEFQYVD